MKSTFPIHGIDCVSCATIIKNKSLKLPGITTCYVDVENKSVEYDYDESIITPEIINKALQKYGYSITVQKNSENSEHSEVDTEGETMKRNLMISIPLVTIALIDMFWMIGGKYGRWSPMSPTISEFFHHLLPMFATVMLFVVGPKYIGAVVRYIRNGTASMDTLVGLGTITAYIYSFVVMAFEANLKPYIDTETVYYEAVIVVIGFIALGKYMEHRAMQQSGQAIKALLGLQAKKAIKLDSSGQEIEVAIEDLQINDLIRIKPGEKVALDAQITQGNSDIDEAMITGESLPVSKKIGDMLIGGTVNLNGSLIARISTASKDSYLAKIIRVVQQAQQSRPAIQALVDSIMNWFIPLVLCIAICSALFWFFFGDIWFDGNRHISMAIASFIGVLVIACPCGIGLATPMAVTTGLGHLAKHGILCKDARGLLKLRKASTIIFDKTGTLTEGKPSVTQSIYISGDQTKILDIIASLESLASHPLATALVAYTKDQGGNIYTVDNFITIPGGGVQGSLDGHLYTLANPSYIQAQGYTIPLETIDTLTREGATPVILTNQTEIMAIFGLTDKIKIETMQAIKALQSMGKELVMISGDHPQVVEHIAKQIGITCYHAGIKPEGKAALVAQIAVTMMRTSCQDDCCDTAPKSTKEDNFIVMVGDGINDAPALAQADIGIAMSTGTDIAIESSDLTLLHGDISKILKAIQISELTHTAILQNLFWAFAYNLIGIPLAAGAFYPIRGWVLNPAFEGMAMASSDLMVIANSLRLQAKKI